MTQSASQSTRKPSRPSWGLAAGLLTGCAVTLMGVGMRLEPETILIRALFGGVVVGMLVSVITNSLRIVTTPHDEE